MADTPRRNPALWLGPLVALVGLLSYFTVFYRWPLTRDFPWVNLILVGAGVALSLLGLARAWRRGGFWAGAGVLSGVVSVAAAGLLVAYCFVLSYQVPSADSALPVGADVPRLVLADANGANVDLGQLGDGRLLLVFYRGHW
jgi:hypothetical protein